MRNVLSYHYQFIPVSSITLDYTTILFNNAWDTQQITATVLPDNASDKTLIWTSDDTSVATVDQTGLVTCVTPGSCTITCTAKLWWVSETCSIIQVVPVTMDRTSYNDWWESYSTKTFTLFTAPSTWYYKITWQFYSTWSSGWWNANHSLSWWTKISWVSSWYVERNQTLNVNCVFYIDTWTAFQATVSSYWYSRWCWWRNFAANYYWEYDPT